MQDKTAFEVQGIQYDVKIAAQIVEIRLAKKMTQRQLAKKLNTTQTAIARLEAGYVPPSHKMLKRLAKAFVMRLEPPKFINF